jgi:hypothetical protein
MASIPGDPAMDSASPTAGENAEKGAFFEGLLRTPASQFAWFMVFGFATRFALFGDPNFFHDELFYFQVGQRMHEGLLPYVDLWDRKGPGLFLTYYLIAAFSHAVAAYQATAWIFASLTAFVIALIAQRFTGRLGAILAGSLYLATLPLFGGMGGQSPVFYNLWVALCGLAVVRAMPSLAKGEVPGWLYAGMASAGFAITFKQTAFCESVFFGTFVLWLLYRAQTPLRRLGRIAAALMLAGAAPMLIFSAFFAVIGHFPEFWHAMVTSNLTKIYNPGQDTLMRITGLTIMFSPALLPAIAGIALRGNDIDRTQRFFLGGWVLAGLAGVAIVPNWFEHYLLPFAVPVCVAAARALDRRPIGPAFAACACFWLLTAGPSFTLSERRESRAALEQLAQDIVSRDPDARILIFEGPVYLYSMLDRYPPSPIFFPLHLYYPPEDGTAFLDTEDEMRKMIAWRPDVVITFHKERPNNENQKVARQVRGYAREECTLWSSPEVIEVYGKSKIDVWGDCNTGKATR